MRGFGATPQQAMQRRHKNYARRMEKFGVIERQARSLTPKLSKYMGTPIQLRDFTRELCVVMIMMPRKMTTP